MGAKQSCIQLASNFREALEQISASSPEIVICDYNLGRNYGLELISHHREAYPNPEDRLFILVTGNAAESVVAEAAEEDVDAYVLKPFTNSSIRYYLVRAGLAKTNPSAYWAELLKGRQLLNTDQLDEALKVFSGALELNAAPALACYYLGQSYDKKGDPELTEYSYKNGLFFNEIHYKCSVSLFDHYVAQNRTADAYGVMKKMSQTFPISPQRLSKALELAVRTQNFDDILHYYTVFSNLDERRDDLRKCVCAALVVGAMFQLRRGQSAAGLDLIQKASITAAGSSMILREIVLILVNYKLVEPATAFLKRFPPETQQSADYLSTELALQNLTGNAEDVIVRGRKLLRDGIQDPLVHRIMIRREQEVGHADEADKLLTESLSIWPEQAESFKKALQLS